MERYFSKKVNAILKKVNAKFLSQALGFFANGFREEKLCSNPI